MKEKLGILSKKNFQLFFELMENRNQRIKKALKEGKVSQEKLGEALGITGQAVSDRLNSEKEIDSIDFVKAVAKLTGQPVNQLLLEFTYVNHDDIKPDIFLHDSSFEYLSGKSIKPITVTVDRSGKELISYVPVKAQAGYMKGYGDAKFMQKLPAFSLPNFNDNGTFRMFQVDGESMRQIGGGGLNDGDVVIGQYVEDIFSLRDNMVYIIVSTEGVVVKRIINRLSTSDKALILKSDNKNGQYANKLIHASEIIEAWEYKAHISRQLSFATDLWDLINDLQASQAILSERVDKMDSATRALLKQNPK